MGGIHMVARKLIGMILAFLLVFAVTTSLAEGCGLGDAVLTAWEKFSEVSQQSALPWDAEGNQLYSFEIGIYVKDHPLFHEVWDVLIYDDSDYQRKWFEAFISAKTGEICWCTGFGDFQDESRGIEEEDLSTQKYEEKWGSSDLWDYTQWHEYGIMEGRSSYLLPISGVLIDYEEALSLAAEAYEAETGAAPDTVRVGSVLYLALWDVEWGITFAADAENDGIQYYHVVIDAMSGAVKSHHCWIKHPQGS